MTTIPKFKSKREKKNTIKVPLKELLDLEIICKLYQRFLECFFFK